MVVVEVDVKVNVLALVHALALEVVMVQVKVTDGNNVLLSPLLNCLLEVDSICFYCNFLQKN